MLLICLDGLSADDAEYLSMRLKWFAGLGKTHELQLIDSGPMLSPQAVWSEFLTGRPFWETGCPGYARPFSGLNDMRIVSEDDLAASVSLPGCSQDDLPIFINVPLLRPCPGRRIWLSDGSQPLHKTVSPGELAEKPPFNEYRGRPYASSALALRDLKGSVRECLALERCRLQCALSLLEKNRDRTCILRLSVFDLLSHLLGADFLHARHLSLWNLIEDFLEYLDSMLLGMVAAAGNRPLFVLSGYRHIDCLGRLSLNQILAEGGFCKLNEPGGYGADSRIAGRLSALKALRQTDESMLELADPAVYGFDLKETFAASPLEGAVYLNRAERFDEGVLDGEEAADMLVRVADFMRSELGNLLPDSADIWMPPSAYGKDLSLAPDLIVSACGLDICNFFGKKVDFESRPRSVHRSEGFLFVPAGARPCEPGGSPGTLRAWEVQGMMQRSAR